MTGPLDVAGPLTFVGVRMRMDTDSSTFTDAWVRTVSDGTRKPTPVETMLLAQAVIELRTYRRTMEEGLAWLHQNDR